METASLRRIMLSLLSAFVLLCPYLYDRSLSLTACTSTESTLDTQLTMILARSVWLFIVTDLDKISIIEEMLALPIFET
jgi:hypothetical protein